MLSNASVRFIAILLCVLQAGFFVMLNVNFGEF